MRVEGVIRTARMRREPDHRSAQAVPRPPDDRSCGHAMALWRGLACRECVTKRTLERPGTAKDHTEQRTPTLAVNTNERQSATHRPSTGNH